MIISQEIHVVHNIQILPLKGRNRILCRCKNRVGRLWFKKQRVHQINENR